MWTWSGTSFGYRSADKLFRHDGLQVGRFEGDEIFAVNGTYLGEVKSGDRLITDRSKKSQASQASLRHAGHRSSSASTMSAT